LTVRKQFARYTFNVEAEIAWQSRKRYGRVIDISRGGMSTELAERPCLGANFTAFLVLNASLRINRTIHRVSSNRGVGVSLCVRPADRKRFEALPLVLGGDVPIATGTNDAKQKFTPAAETAVR